MIAESRDPMDGYTADEVLDMIDTDSERRVLTVPAARSASPTSHRTRAAREASLTARSRRQSEAAGNPQCPRCGTSTVQNAPEASRRIYWCWRCQKYPFGSGFGPDAIEQSPDSGSSPGRPHIKRARKSYQ